MLDASLLGRVGAPAPPGLEPHFRFNYEHAKSLLERQGGFLPRVIIIPGKTDDGVEPVGQIIMATFDTEEAKTIFSRIVMIRAFLADAEEVSFLSEAWGATMRLSGAGSAQAWIDEHGSLESFPGRNEVVVSHLETREGQLSASWVQRRESKTKSTLEPFDMSTTRWFTREDIQRGLVQGRFGSFLSPRRRAEAPPEMVEAAVKALAYFETLGGWHQEEFTVPSGD